MTNTITYTITSSVLPPQPDELEQRRVALINRLRMIDLTAQTLPAPNATAAADIYAVRQAAQATAANIMRSELIRNRRDLERTVAEKEKEADKLEEKLRRWQQEVII